MRVLLINNCHYRRGGAETVYYLTADMLKRAGHEVVFYSFENDKNIHTGEEEYFVKKASGIKSIVSYCYNKDAAKTLDYILANDKYDIAHAHLMWGGMTGAIIPVLHKHGVPLVHSVHDYRMVCPAYTFRNGKGQVCESCKGERFSQCVRNRCAKGSLLKSILMAYEMSCRNKKRHPANELDGIIYVSFFAKTKHEEIDARFASVTNTVLYNSSTLGKKYPPLEEDGGYYLYYGRLSGEKGVETLVNAISKHPEIPLKIVGTGPIINELRKKSYPNISFLGYKTGDELYNLVRAAKYVCVPSEWYENNPMTIVEAYSMGVPVIGARIGGIPEIVMEGKTGFLFESGNQDSLEVAVRKSLMVSGDSYKTMKKNACDFALDHFNSETYPEKLVGFYEEVIRSFYGGNQKD